MCISVAVFLLYYVVDEGKYKYIETYNELKGIVISFDRVWILVIVHEL
mgnify:CR=1 FL=1